MKRRNFFVAVILSALACLCMPVAQGQIILGDHIKGANVGYALKGHRCTYALSQAQVQDCGYAVKLSGNDNALGLTDSLLQHSGVDGVHIEGTHNTVTIGNTEIAQSGAFAVNIEGEGNAATLTGGHLSGLRVGRSATMILMGGPLDGKLVVAADSIVIVYGSLLKLTETRLDGVLADGTNVGLDVEKENGARILLYNTNRISLAVSLSTPKHDAPRGSKSLEPKEARAHEHQQDPGRLPGLPDSSESSDSPKTKHDQVSPQTANLVKELAELRVRLAELEKEAFAGKAARDTSTGSRHFGLHEQDRLVDAGQWGDDIPNPFVKITAAGQAKLAARGIDVKRMQKMKTVRISGQHMGASPKVFINVNSEIAVLLSKDFNTHGWVYSAGPLLVETEGRNRIMGSVVGSQLVWFIGTGGLPMSTTTGNPIIVAPTVNVRMGKFATKDVWSGDYGL